MKRFVKFIVIIAVSALFCFSVSAEGYEVSPSIFTYCSVGSRLFDISNGSFTLSVLTGRAMLKPPSDKSPFYTLRDNEKYRFKFIYSLKLDGSPYDLQDCKFYFTVRNASNIKVVNNGNGDYINSCDVRLSDYPVLDENGCFNFDTLYFNIGETYTGDLNVTIKSINISVVDPNEDLIEEDYGYSKPDTSSTDEGLTAGNNLLDDLTEKLDDFNNSLNDDTTAILDDLEPFKNMTNGFFNIIPAPVQYLVTFAVVFLVIRKVVGR